MFRPKNKNNPEPFFSRPSAFRPISTAGVHSFAAQTEQARLFNNKRLFLIFALTSGAALTYTHVTGDPELRTKENYPPTAMRHYAAMKSLQYPRLASTVASIAQSGMQQDGWRRDLTIQLLDSLTSSFTVGEDVEQAARAADLAKQRGMTYLLDYVKEMEHDPKARKQVYHTVLKLIESSKEHASSYIPIKLTALIAPAILEKITAGEALTVEESKLYMIEHARLEDIVKRAQAHGVYLYVDQEYPNQKQAIFDISLDLMRRYNTNAPVIYLTVQATDADCFTLAKRIAEDKTIKFPALKLVNGAYVNWAHENNYADAMQPSKMNAFVAYVTIARYCMKQNIHLFAGTHNPELEKLIKASPDYAQAKANDKVTLAQLLGFETKRDVNTLYALFGPKEDCVDYAIRRVIEGSESRKATEAPVLALDDAKAMVENSDLNVEVTDEEITDIAKAIKIDVQEERSTLAAENVINSIFGGP